MVRVLIPVVLALVVGGLILLVLGKNPLTYYGYVLERGLLRWGGLQETLTRMSPLLLIAAGLIVAFRAGIWNLGGDGQFLLAAVITAALGPALIDHPAARRDPGHLHDRLHGCRGASGRWCPRS